MIFQHDENGHIVPLAEAVIAIAEDHFTDLSTAQTVNLEDDATFLQVSAYDGVVAVKYNGTATTSDFDEILTESESMHRVIKKDITSVSFIAITTGAKVAVIQK